MVPGAIKGRRAGLIPGAAGGASGSGSIRLVSGAVRLITGAVESGLTGIRAEVNEAGSVAAGKEEAWEEGDEAEGDAKGKAKPEKGEKKDKK